MPDRLVLVTCMHSQNVHSVTTNQTWLYGWHTPALMHTANRLHVSCCNTCTESQWCYIFILIVLRSPAPHYSWTWHVIHMGITWDVTRHMHMDGLQRQNSMWVALLTRGLWMAYATPTITAETTAYSTMIIVGNFHGRKLSWLWLVWTFRGDNFHGFTL